MFSFGKMLHVSGVEVAHSGDHSNEGLVSRNALIGPLLALFELSPAGELLSLDIAVLEPSEVEACSELVVAWLVVGWSSALVLLASVVVSLASIEPELVVLISLLESAVDGEVVDAPVLDNTDEVVSLELGPTGVGSGFVLGPQLENENAATPSVAAKATRFIARRSFRP
jgi:hypothetical protein